MKKRWCALLVALLLSGMLAFAGGETLLMWNEVNGEKYGAAVGARVFARKLKELSGHSPAVRPAAAAQPASPTPPEDLVTCVAAAILKGGPACPS